MRTNASAAAADHLTQIDRDCLRIAATKSLRLWRSRRRGVPSRWAPGAAGPHFFPGTVDKLRRRRLLACEVFNDEEICFASPEGMAALAALPTDDSDSQELTF